MLVSQAKPLRVDVAKDNSLEAWQASVQRTLMEDEGSAKPSASASSPSAADCDETMSSSGGSSSPQRTLTGDAQGHRSTSLKCFAVLCIMVVVLPVAAAEGASCDEICSSGFDFTAMDVADGVSNPGVNTTQACGKMCALQEASTTFELNAGSNGCKMSTYAFGSSNQVVGQEVRCVAL